MKNKKIRIEYLFYIFSEYQKISIALHNSIKYNIHQILKPFYFEKSSLRKTVPKSLQKVLSIFEHFLNFSNKNKMDVVGCQKCKVENWCG